MRFRDVGSPGFTWADCWAIYVSLPPDSPLHRAKNPKDWHWYVREIEFLAGIYDAVNHLAATVAKQPGVKKKDIPKPLVRPWDKVKEEQKIVGDKMPLDEMRQALGW